MGTALHRGGWSCECCNQHDGIVVEREEDVSLDTVLEKRLSRFAPVSGGRVDQAYEMQIGRDGILGHSSIGFIVKADHRDSRTLRAVKQICKRSIEGQGWKDEIETISTLSHDHICCLHEYWEDPLHVYLIMELCNGGDVTNLGSSTSHINESTMAALVWQMASAVSALHERKVFHSDIRLENWLFGEPVLPNCPRSIMSLKMIDFGIAQKFGRGTRGRRSSDREAREVLSGLRPPVKKLMIEEEKRLRLRTDQTLFCQSPEQLAVTGDVSEKVDVWALGVIAYFLLSGQPPFQSAMHSTDAALFRSATFVFMPPELWRPVSSEAKNFIAMCLQRFPAKRPPASQVLSLPWMILGEQAAGDLTNGTGTRRACARPGDVANAEVVDPNLPSAFRLAQRLGQMGRLHVLEKAAIVAVAHQLTAPRIEELRHAVESRDKANDGSVSVSSLFEELESAGVWCQDLAKLMQDIDTAGIVTIDYAVFCNDVAEFQKNLQDSAAWSVFRRFENNGGQSHVKRKDINKVLVQDGNRDGITDKLMDKFPDLEMDTLLQELDHDAAGVIEFEEFRDILRGS